MQISLNIKNESISQKVLEFLSSFKKEEIKIETIDDKPFKEESLSSFVGMWKDRDITIETLREAAWKK
ncbi:hypothetical protein [Sulfurimonas sp.]|uniref:hypothetical protein n=1 Tax=Sulfurimonas sp. TaxID=2022749 RepID=UPI001A0C1354|nr:hypothetical protein [Sulfurimonas sp.]MBE0514356.1 hypothetical protein [Sulfurimonas sp.]